MSSGSVAFLQQARRLRFELALRLKASGRVRRELEDIIDTYVRLVVGRRLPAADLLATDLGSAYDMVKGNSIVERAQEK